MYHADTGRDTIWQYDYDVSSGVIANKRVFAEASDGHPDGLAIDEAGNVYAAMYGGSHVAVFDTSGRAKSRIDLPVPNPTSCAFGGNDLRRLYITTAFEGMSEQDRAEAPLSGSVFVIEVDIGGLGVPSTVAPESLPTVAIGTSSTIR